MAISLKQTDDVKGQHQDALIWPKSADRAKTAALEGIFVKCPETGDLTIGYDDLDEIVGKEVIIRVNDGNDSEYVGTFDDDGKFVKS